MNPTTRKGTRHPLSNRYWSALYDGNKDVFKTIGRCCDLISLAGMACSLFLGWKFALFGLGLLTIRELFASLATDHDTNLYSLPRAHWSVSYSSAWILYIRFTNRENKTLHAAHQKHGSVVRIGPSEVSTNAIDGGIKVVYGGGLEKGVWYSVFNNYGSADTPNVEHS